jgi:acetyltransferase-like isoleucine patch superfamily enzyme
MTLANIEQYIADVTYCVSGFNVEPINYIELSPGEAGIKGDESNRLFCVDGKLPENCTLTFGEKAKNCKVFLGESVKCKGSRITLNNEGTVLYIGKASSLTNVSIALLCKGDFVIVGEGVSVTSTSNWSTGFNPGKKNNGIIIGDHCLMASEIAIRPADGHPIIDLDTGKQVNISTSPIIIEPYCWIGQRAAILKNVRIGACSILSFNAVVTKSCDKFSVMGGVPAKARSIAGKMWLRNFSAEAKKIQEMYAVRFSAVPVEAVNVGEPSHVA